MATEQPLAISISGDAASAFREHFKIDSGKQATDALANADSLFAAGGHPWAGDERHAPDRETFDWAAENVKKRFDSGRYKDGELTPPKPQKEKSNTSGTTRHVAHATEEWKAVCTAPDLCRVGKDVVAFDSYATLEKKKRASDNVKARGSEVYRKNDLIQGVKADAGKHITAGTSQGSGHVKILEGHDTVKVGSDKIPIARHDSKCLVNCDASGNGGAAGKLVTEQKTVGGAPASKASNPNAPPGQRTSPRLERLKDAKAKLESGQLNFNALDEYVNFKDANKGMDGLIGQIQGTPGTAGDYAAQATRGILGFGKDIVMGIGELAYEGIKGVPKLGRMAFTSNGQAINELNGQILAENINLGNITPGTIGQGALDVGAAIVKPITDPWKRGDYVESVTRGAAEAVTAPIAWTKAQKAAQAAKAKTALEAAEAAKAKAALEAEEALKAKAALEAEEAAKAGDGVHVSFRGKVKYRTAANANEELLDMHRATKDTLPFKEGTMVAEREMVPGERFKMSMDTDQFKLLNDPNSPKGVGGWGTSETFANQSDAMNGMAIRPEWKPNGVPVTVEFEVVKPFRTLDGIAGPQGSLTGGAQQFFLDLPRTGAKDYLRIVGSKMIPK
jgi:hypothetical protein